MTILRRASEFAASTSAVMPGALPAEWRFTLVTAPPTSPLSIFETLWFWSVANAEYRNGQASRSCRVALASSALMCRRQSLRLVAAAHHRFILFDAL